MLMDINFPGSSDSLEINGTANAGARASHKRKEWSLAAEIVNADGAKWATLSFEPYKAPGPDGILPILLQKGLNALLQPIVKTMRASIALRHISRTWIGTKVVFIPKPGRNGHIKAKDFRPISLSSFFLKTLERLIDRFLKEKPLIYHPLASSQYAYRESRSTEIALHHLVRQIETQLEAKGYALGVFLDIEGAFDSTSSKVICNAMDHHGVPDALVDWTRNMLEGRELTISHGEVKLAGRPAKGCPQGGVLSPLLWSLVIHELLAKLKEADFMVFGYADDVTVIIRDSF